MSLLKKLENEQAFLKWGGFGFEGSGKTTTMALIAIGLHRQIKSKKPVAFFDTETGSAYVKPLFDYAGIDLVGVRSRSLKDLGETIKEAEQSCDIIIADSLTHPYKELCTAYVRNKKDGTKFIRMQDWQPIKDQWNTKFSEPYVNSKIHFLWGARAKNLFEDVLDVEASAQSGKEIFKSVQSGVSARAETESAFEPGILVSFDREMIEEGNVKGKKSGIFRRKMTVVKDRFMILDGQSFYGVTPIKGGKIDMKKLVDENPTFQFFLPHISRLNLGGSHDGFNGSTSDELFDDNGRMENQRKRDEATIKLEEIENTLTQYWPAHQGQDKIRKLTALKWAFGTNSWTAITKMSLEEIRAGHAKITGEKAVIFDAVDNYQESPVFN